ncbi:unnamed protein product, partial [marine sediment metagenome]
FTMSRCDVGHHNYALVGLNDAKQIEIFCSTGQNTTFWVIGYFNKNAVFLDDCPNRPPLVANSWQTIDFSDIAPDAMAGIFLVGPWSGHEYDAGLRPFGSTNDWHYPSRSHFALVKMVNGKVDCYRHSSIAVSAMHMYLTGYLKSGGDFRTNAIDITPLDTGLWVPVGIHVGAEFPTLISVECFTTTGYTYFGSRKTKSYRDILSRYPRHTFNCVHPAIVPDIELWRDTVDVHFKQHGTLY